MTAIWDFLFDNGFMPHGYCLLWDPALFWTHAISDAVIAVSYFSIPLVLVMFAIKRYDFEYRWVLYLFGTFIVCCGITHVMGIWTLWVPSYYLEGGTKVFTAVVSAVTAIGLWPLLPKIIALPGTSDLKVANEALAAQIRRRYEAQAELQSLYDELEQRVAERTRDLEAKNRELAEATRLANQANEAKARFLSMMSHEIRTPLHGVLSMAELLLESGLDDDQRTYAESAVRSSQSLIAIVNDILDFSKIESGRLALKPEETDLIALCEDVVGSVAPIAQDRGLEIATLIGDTVPTRAKADPVRLRQVLTNLVGNAIRFTDVGSVVLHVDCRGVADDKRLVLTVEDTGIGIALDKQDAIFDRFTQVEDSSLDVERGGTGLGLPICKGLVDLMNGRLTVDSERGKGSRFTVDIPLSGARREPVPQPPVADAIVIGKAGATLRELRALLDRRNVPVAALDAAEAAERLAGRTDTAVFALTGLDGQAPDLAPLADFPGRLIVLEPLSAPAAGAADLGLPADRRIERLRYPLRRNDVYGLLDLAVTTPTSVPESPRAAAEPERIADVLVVDDNRENLLVATEVLRKTGHRAVTRQHTPDALTLLRHQKFDLVLMDLRMPEIDGFELTRIVRREDGPNRDVPIVAVSANVMPETALRIDRAGMNGYLSKPYRPSQLRDLVQAYLAPEEESESEAERASGLLLDADYLKELAEFGSEESLISTVRSFLEQFDGRMRRLDEARGAQALRDAVHGLAGAAGVVGLMRLSGVCHRVESLIADGDLSRAQAELDSLVSLARSSRDALDHALERRLSISASA